MNPVLTLKKESRIFKIRLNCVFKLIPECLNSYKITLLGGLFGILVC